MGSVSMLDVARGAYVRLPDPARAQLGRLLRFVPTSLKFGRTYRAWRGRIARAQADGAYAGRAQAEALDAVVALACSRAPFYARTLAPLLERRGGGPLRDSAAWRGLPILDRQAVLAGGEAMCTVPLARLDRASTDGSSGEPLAFWLDRNRSPVEYAFIHQAWSRAGFGPGDWRAVFRGFDSIGAGPDPWEVEPALRELRLSVFHLDDATMARYAQVIAARRIAFLHGYPSALALFAEYLMRCGRGPLDAIRGVFPISEKLYPHQRAAVGAAFPAATLVPFYGLSEKVAFAVERPGAPDTYVFDPLYGFTELVDGDGGPVTRPGEVGRLVSTGLLFRGMPLIRYDTRDTAELVEPASAANGFRLVVRRLMPRRSTDYVVGRSGRIIPLSGFCTPVDAAGTYGAMQFFQDTAGIVELRVPAGTDGAVDYTAYARRMASRAGQDLALEVVPVDALPVSSRGKRKFLDQRLALPAAP